MDICIDHRISGTLWQHERKGRNSRFNGSVAPHLPAVITRLASVTCALYCLFSNQKPLSESALMTDRIYPSAGLSYLIHSSLADIHRRHPVIISLIPAHRTGIQSLSSVSCLLIHIRAMRTCL